MSLAILAAWSAIDSHALNNILSEVDHPPPEGFTPLLLQGHRIGWLAPGHDDALLRHLPLCQRDPSGLRWLADELTAADRSELLARTARSLQQDGWITGWRDEPYSYWGEIEEAPSASHSEWFRMERAAFRFLGLRSHAVHTNGFCADGRIWCGRRALSKATDPGRLDNLAAGGLPAGESLLDCAVRELYEEAGIPPEVARQVHPAGSLLTRRREKEGWHDERLWVYNLMLPEGLEPRNQDGEVSEFVCLSPDQAMARWAEMTEDAAGVLAQGLLALRPQG